MPRFEYLNRSRRHVDNLEMRTATALNSAYAAEDAASHLTKLNNDIVNRETVARLNFNGGHNRIVFGA